MTKVSVVNRAYSRALRRRIVGNTRGARNVVGPRVIPQPARAQVEYAIADTKEVGVCVQPLEGNGNAGLGHADHRPDGPQIEAPFEESQSRYVVFVAGPRRWRRRRFPEGSAHRLLRQRLDLEAALVPAPAAAFAMDEGLKLGHVPEVAIG